MPGLKELQAGAARVKVIYAALPDGAEIRFETTDPALSRRYTAGSARSCPSMARTRGPSEQRAVQLAAEIRGSASRAATARGLDGK